MFVSVSLFQFIGMIEVLIVQGVELLIAVSWAIVSEVRLHQRLSQSLCSC